MCKKRFRVWGRRTKIWILGFGFVVEIEIGFFSFFFFFNNADVLKKNDDVELFFFLNNADDLKKK